MDTYSKCQPARPTINGFSGLVDGALLQTLLDAVEDQRVNLVNVLGIVHSMSRSFTDVAEDSAPEVCAAFDLLEQELRRVVAGLDQASLCDLTQEIAAGLHARSSTGTAQTVGESGDPTL